MCICIYIIIYLYIYIYTHTHTPTYASKVGEQRFFKEQGHDNKPKRDLLMLTLTGLFLKKKKVGEQRFFKEQGYDNKPTRCPQVSFDTDIRSLLTLILGLF